MSQEPTPQPRILNEIIDVKLAVRKKAPPELEVTVTAQTPTPGFTDVRLVRAVYRTPPKDGIQDYFLLATPPEGIVIQVLSKTTAQDVWSDFPQWVKGVRIHGVGTGVKVKMIR
ncbi:MAG: hypothetical protein N2039_05560 [Gemmataceae bacterium]|nr:hypothetical protein [Gemmataceae bacterium]